MFIKELNSLAKSLGKLKKYNEAKELLLVKNAYLVNNMASLRRYLTDKQGRQIEVIDLNRKAFFDWLEERLDEDPYMLSEMKEWKEKSWDNIIVWKEDPWDVDLSIFPENILNKYLLGGWWRDEIDAVYTPSWDCMDYISLVKDEWLIHFTENAYGISNNGFLYGINELDKLCLTTHFNMGLKQEGGYNFAYPISYKKALKTGLNYGSEAVVFRANGIKVWHHGDEEYQVIFEGSTARDIIPLIISDEKWMAGDLNHGFEDLETAVNWINNNFNQYKKVLVSNYK